MPASWRQILVEKIQASWRRTRSRPPVVQSDMEGIAAALTHRNGLIRPNISGWTDARAVCRIRICTEDNSRGTISYTNSRNAYRHNLPSRVRVADPYEQHLASNRASPVNPPAPLCRGGFLRGSCRN